MKRMHQNVLELQAIYDYALIPNLSVYLHTFDALFQEIYLKNIVKIYIIIWKILIF